MDVTGSIIHVINFILGIIGFFGVLFLFPLVILGITLLIISTNKSGENKKKFKFWGIMSLVLSVGLILVPMILFALLNAILVMY